jgi:hypothetical protein
MQWIALFLFFVIGFVLSCPLLTAGGETAANYKMTLFLLVFFRLAWRIYKHTFRFRDYFIYSVLTIGFCLWVDSHF